MHRTLPVVSQMFECDFMCMYMSVCVCVCVLWVGIGIFHKLDRQIDAKDGPEPADPESRHI